MSYSINKHTKTLELDIVLKRLSDEAFTCDAKEKALCLEPSLKLAEVDTRLRQTEDAYLLIAKYSAPGFSGALNVKSSLARASIGALISAGELLNILSLLKTIRTARAWRDNCDASKEISIDYLFNALSPNKFLEDKIGFAIKSPEEINDNASPALADIRRKITSKASKIRDDLEKIIHGKQSKFLQDSLITQRDGRFVVPVKAEHKGEIKGILHDTSSSGSTLFIEPISVVEANNDIRVLKAKEQEEITRILAELSSDCADFADSICASYDAVVELDLIFAKAKLAYKMGASMPKINNKGYVYLNRARHPLLNQKTVVPITVTLGDEYNTLIITGPNTGGKTVALKTIGLLSLMAMCGMMIPADDNSEIAVFGKIFADIGDEQSIEQSLSTFSSHIVNIISILEECDNNSLVLFDELCAGTDPIEGAALAKAILMYLLSKGTKSVATTHYPELKAYALDTDMVQNASCEFDVSTLKPTYRLIIGVPGRSNAFAISKRLGMSGDIIKLAEAEVNEEDLRFENVVASLEKARYEAELEREQARKLRYELELAKKRSDSIENELKIKREKLMEQTREKANNIIENARYKGSLLLNELEEIKKAFNAENSAENLQRARADYKKTLKELESASDPVFKNENLGKKLLQIPKINDIVIVESIGRDATVLDVNEKTKKVFVMSGSIKMWVDLGDLSVKKSNSSTETPKKRNITGIASRADRIVSGELDIRGLASDEAIIELDKYLDNAVMAGINSVRIIHGKGTGTLRAAVQAHLRAHKSVKSFRVGLFGEGENGVTIAELN